jgi:hypothetical protein
MHSLHSLAAVCHFLHLDPNRKYYEYIHAGRRTECNTCPSGKYANKDGQKECFVCKGGMYVTKMSIEAHAEQAKEHKVGRW